MPDWFHPSTAPTRVQGRGLAEDNFAQENRPPLDILIREALQNPLDARERGNTGPVTVRIRYLEPGQYDLKYLRSLLPAEFCNRLQASMPSPPLLNFDAAGVLTIEDFGTTGLEGLFDDPNADGDTQNWNAFWFREGEGAKSGGSNGRAGQGKITYYRVGTTRAVFGLTVRATDRKKLLMGRSSFRRVYPYGGDKYERDSFWCQKEGEYANPITDIEHTQKFEEAFSLQRGNKNGLSLVIPFADKVVASDAARTVIAEFFCPIIAGRLEVEIEDIAITAANVERLADKFLPDNQAKANKSPFSHDFRKFASSIVIKRLANDHPVAVSQGWEKREALVDKSFPDREVERLQAGLSSGDIISVRFPINVHHRDAAPFSSYFDVYLQQPETLDRVEEAYIRKDLLIGNEIHLGKASYLPVARGATIIDEENLSALLADAEEPTHLRWNASRPRLSEDYKKPGDVVRAVRRAMPMLLSFLSGKTLQKDLKALAKYFTSPSEEGATPKPKDATRGGEYGSVGPVDIPPPRRKPFRVEADEDWVKVVPNGEAAPLGHELPINCTLEVAYEGLDQDPFAAYDPFDFDLGSNTLRIESRGIEEILRKENRLLFKVVEPGFSVVLRGFDSNIRLRARLQSDEVNSAYNNDTE